MRVERGQGVRVLADPQQPRGPVRVYGRIVWVLPVRGHGMPSVRPGAASGAWACREDLSAGLCVSLWAGGDPAEMLASGYAWGRIRARKYRWGLAGLLECAQATRRYCGRVG